MSTEARGVKNLQNQVNVVCVWPLNKGNPWTRWKVGEGGKVCLLPSLSLTDQLFEKNWVPFSNIWQSVKICLKINGFECLQIEKIAKNMSNSFVHKPCFVKVSTKGTLGLWMNPNLIVSTHVSMENNDVKLVWHKIIKK